MDIPSDEMEVCLSVLQRVANARGTFRGDERFNGLISKVYREGKRYDTDHVKRRQEVADRAVMASTAMVQIQRDPAAPELPAPNAGGARVLHQSESCYICKAEFTEVHFFYHLLCPKCAAFNYEMRDLHANLKGRVALVTGGRVKIGHQTVLRLLRDGANVIVTTRFPNAAAKRLEAEPDSASWIGRVRVFGLDLRNIPAVEEFARHMLRTEPHIDIVIHNAAQTIRRPSGFYAELVAQELDPAKTLSPAALRLVAQGAPSTLAIAEPWQAVGAPLPHFTPALSSEEREQSPDGMPQTEVAAGMGGNVRLRGPVEGDGGGASDLLPADALHDNEERADSRLTNSWMLKLDEVGAAEMLEVQLVNSVAPFILNSRLKPLMMRAPFERRFIVNVSAMEGQFARNKTVYHPHTNMAKAALNMMTRTSADDYARDRIYMTSVDTGWVTDENPTERRVRKQKETGFYAPLDIVDGMARIYHPIAHGVTRPEEPFYGVFLKDYAPCAW